MKKRTILVISSFIIFLIALFFPNNYPIYKNILFILSYIISGYKVIFKAFKNIFKGKVFDENFLMTIATIGAFFIGEFAEAVCVMIFYQVGELFQDYAVDKSRKSIASLMDIRPDYANIYVNKKIKKVNPKSVNIKDIIVVKPGEKIPLDGKIIEGKTTLNMQALTGESIPKRVQVNDEVLSGCINIEGLIKIEVTKRFEESTVSKILDLVENASSRKAKSENFITKFSKYYTPIVVIIALFLSVFPPLIFHASFNDWIYRALSFLVVSCPCALVISIPLSFFGGIGAASKIGVLIKGSNYLENLSNTKIVVCDKTGTLTKGVFEIQKINPKKISKEELLMYAAHAECYSNHPIAISIKDKYNKTIDEKIVKKVKEFAGLGISAIVNKKEVLIGNEKLMIKNNIEYVENSEIGSIVYIAVDNVFVGTILISDTIKDSSYKAIKSLRENNINNIIMLTGDSEKISHDVAKKLGIDTYFSCLLPNDKVLKVEELMKNIDGKLLFIGDGVNDAPVLAISDIGVSMGSIGSDAAVEASDIVIMNDDISKLSDCLNISKKTMRIVKENIVFAISIKIIVLILSAFGISTMWEAVFADVGVSILAILNALRILKIKNIK